MAASGVLITRAAFTAHLYGLAVVCAVTLAAMSYLIWRHGQTIYRRRGAAGGFPHHQPGALSLLTTATVLTAAVAIFVTIAI